VKARRTKSKKNKGPIERDIKGGCRKAECISSTADSAATIQSEVKANGESIFQSHHSVGGDSERKIQEAEENDIEKEKGR
jgi:hypothetical protein